MRNWIYYICCCRRAGMVNVLAARWISVVLLTMILAWTLTGCVGSGHKAAPTGEGDTLTSAAELLTIVDYGDYKVVDIAGAWDGDRLTRYLLVPRDYEGELPAVGESVVVRTPVERSVVFSSVHGGVIDELGAIDAISGVADGRFFIHPALAAAIGGGRIADVGNSMSPSVEKIVECGPDVLLTSPYQGGESLGVERLGVPVVGMVDYMESTPLGRAEWIKLIGALYGRQREADSIYASVVDDYNGLRDMASRSSSQPKVLTERPLAGGVWDVAAGESYMARMIADAGGIYPWRGSLGRGSLKLDVAAVYDAASDADLWLIRAYGPLTMNDLRQSSPLISRIKAMQRGAVYVSDTSQSMLFDEFPFHPERLLREYIKIFHPDLAAEMEDGMALRYFTRIGD